MANRQFEGKSATFKKQNFICPKCKKCYDSKSKADSCEKLHKKKEAQKKEAERNQRKKRLQGMR